MRYDASPFAGLPTVVKNLLIINVIFFLVKVTHLGDFGGTPMTTWLGLHFFASPLFEPWQLVTHMFMHGDPFHLLFNMFGLFMFGPPLEYKWGSKRFLTFYMITGIGAALFYSGANAIAYFELLDQLDPAAMASARQGLVAEGDWTSAQFRMAALLYTPMVGASGALYGVLLAFGLIYPNVLLYTFPLPVPIRAKYLVMFLGGLAIFHAWANNPYDNVAHLAHLGGMVVGYIMIRAWDHRNPRPFGH